MNYENLIDELIKDLEDDINAKEKTLKEIKLSKKPKTSPAILDFITAQTVERKWFIRKLEEMKLDYRKQNNG